MPQNLWKQYRMGRRLRGAESERERLPHGFDLCYAMQSNRETADEGSARETARRGRGCGFALGSGGREDESHASLSLSAVHHAIRITNTQHKEREEHFRHTGQKQNVLSQQQRGANRRCTVVNIHPRAPTSVVKSNSSQAQSPGQLRFRQPLPSHSHQAQPKPSLLHSPVKKSSGYSFDKNGLGSNKRVFEALSFVVLKTK